MSYKLSIRGTYAKLTGDLTPEEHIRLSDSLAYYPGDNLGDCFQMYSNGVCYRGVVDDLLLLLKREGIVPEIDDSSTNVRNPDKHTFLREDVFAENLESVDKMSEAGFGVLVAPPGSGKTVCMAGITCAYGVRTAIVVQQREVMDQALDAFKNFTDIKNVGVLGNGKKDLQDVTVVTIQTLNKKLGVDQEITDWWKSVECVIIDECHHGVADSYLKAIQHAKASRFFHGVTATYRRDCELDYALNKLFGPVVHSIQYKTQIDLGTIVPTTFFFDPVKPKNYGFTSDGSNQNRPQNKRLQEMQQVYKDYIINGSTGRNKQILKFVEACRENNRTVVCVVKVIEHAEVLARIIPDSVILHGKTPAKLREQILDQLKHREIDCVISTLFDEAVNIPSLDAVALVAGGKSTVKAEQRLRATRSCDKVLRTGRYTKTRGFVYYPIDRADYLIGHSASTKAFYKGIAAQHPDNKVVELPDTHNK